MTMMRMMVVRAYTQNTYGGFTCRCILRIVIIIIMLWMMKFAVCEFHCDGNVDADDDLNMTLETDGGILGKSSIYRYILRISVIIIIMLKSSWCCSITLIVLSVGVQPRS